MSRRGATLLRQLGRSRRPPQPAPDPPPAPPAPADEPVAAPSSVPPPAPGAGDAQRREQVGAEIDQLLAQLDETRPGTLRRRVLKLGGGSGGARAAALAEAFERCDAADLAAIERLPFQDESFEFVWSPVEPSELARGADPDRWPAEILRVLRLRGVAAIDVRAAVEAPADRAPSPPEEPVGFAARIDGPAWLSSGVADGQLVPVTVTNTGDRTWPGSGPHRLELIVSGSARTTAIELPGSLTPGDSFELTVGLREPLDHAEGAIELYVRASSLGRVPLRSRSTRIAVHASSGIRADVERAGGVVLATHPLEPGTTRLFVGRP
jgi:hypothetical protein